LVVLLLVVEAVMVVVGGVAGVLVAAELEAPTAQELESEDLYFRTTPFKRHSFGSDARGKHDSTELSK